MRSRFLVILDWAYPFIIALLVAVLAFTAATPRVHIPLFGGESLSMGDMNVRILLLFVAFSFLAIPMFRNYAKFCPNEMKLKVCFDTEGIVAALQTFSQAELREIRIKEDWMEKKYNLWYLDEVNSLARKFHLPDYVNVTETAYSEGRIIIRVRRLRGWQKYQLEEFQGFMYYRFVDEDGNVSALRDEFELLLTNANVITFTLKDLFSGGSKIFQPRFSHYVPLGPTHLHEEAMIVIAVSKLTPFANPIFGKTLYCIEDRVLLNKPNDKPKLIPIAYGLYSSL